MTIQEYLEELRTTTSGCAALVGRKDFGSGLTKELVSLVGELSQVCMRYMIACVIVESMLSRPERSHGLPPLKLDGFRSVCERFSESDSRPTREEIGLAMAQAQEFVDSLKALSPINVGALD